MLMGSESSGIVAVELEYMEGADRTERFPDENTLEADDLWD